MQFEGCMKFCAQSFSRLAWVLVFALATAGAGAAQVAPPVGPYGFVLNATFSDPSTHGGAAILGLMNFDGAGNVSGPYALELGTGGVNHDLHITGTFTGIYSSNPDGTGTISIVLVTQIDGVNITVANATLAMVVDNRGRDLQLALTACTGVVCDLTGTVVSGFAQIEFNGLVHPVHTGFLNGTYGLQFTKSSPTPLTVLAVLSFDGAGNVTLSGAFVGPGPTVGNDTQTGTYSVNPDGTGTITIPPPPGLSLGKTYVFVITSGHSGLMVLQTNRAGDGVLYGSGKHQ